MPKQQKVQLKNKVAASKPVKSFQKTEKLQEQKLAQQENEIQADKPDV